MAVNTKSFRARHGVAVGDDTTFKEIATNTGKWVGDKVNPDRGGTGLNVIAAGDLLYGVAVVAPAAGATTDQSLAKLAIGTASKMLRSTGSAPAWSTSTYPDQAPAEAGKFLRSDGTNFVNSTLILPDAATANDILYGSAANTIGRVSTAVSSLFVTNGSGVPSWSTTVPEHSVTTSISVPVVKNGTGASAQLTIQGTSNATKHSASVLFTDGVASSNSTTGTVVVTGGVGISGNLNLGGSVASGTWAASVIGLSYGGTNNNLTASNGGIVWSDNVKLNILSGTSTANKMLLSGNTAAPSWGPVMPTAVTAGTAADGKVIIAGTSADTFITSTAKYPVTAASSSGKLLRSDGTDFGVTNATYPGTTSNLTSGKLLYSSSTTAVAETSNISWNESVLNLGSSVLLKINNAATTANTVLGVNNTNTGHEYKTLASGEGVSVTHVGTNVVFSLAGVLSGDTAKNASTWSTYKVGQHMLVGAASTSTSKVISTASHDGITTATFTSASHGFIAGSRVVITNVVPSGYNGAFVVLAADANTFTVSIPTNPGAYSSGGSIYYEYLNINTANALDIRAGAGTSLTNLISAYSSNDTTTQQFSVSIVGNMMTNGNVTVGTPTIAVKSGSEGTQVNLFATSTGVINIGTTGSIVNVKTIADPITTRTSGSKASLSGTATTLLDSTVLANFRSIVYEVQVTQGSNYEFRQIAMIHNGSAPSWTESNVITIGTIGGTLTYDFAVNGSDMEFKASYSSMASTTIKWNKRYMAQ